MLLGAQLLNELSTFPFEHDARLFGSAPLEHSSQSIKASLIFHADHVEQRQELMDADAIGLSQYTSR